MHMNADEPEIRRNKGITFFSIPVRKEVKIVVECNK